MNKRQNKKNLKGLLTNEELIVLELYRKSSDVNFYLHDCELYEAYKFTKAVVKEPAMQHYQGRTWLKGEFGKIKATAFFKEQKK